MRTRLPRWWLVALVAAMALGACGNGGDTESADGSAASRSGRSERFSLLPGAAVVGRGYRLASSSITDPPEPLDPATTTTSSDLRSANGDRPCPEAHWPRLGAHPDVPGVDYVRFVGEDDREVTVGYAPVPAALDRAGMDELLEQINACTATKERHAFAVFTETRRAEELHGVGDYGIDIHWSSEVAMADGSPDPMGPISLRTYLFVVDDTLVAVEASGGFDLDQLHSVTGDEDIVPTVAAFAAERLAG